MNLDHLKNFLVVAERNNISAAAKVLNLSQPALSRQMRVLEEDTNLRLFNRGGKSVNLTREGKILLEEGNQLILQVSDSMRRIANRISGKEIRLSYAPSLTSSFLKQAISSFVEVHPSTRMSLSDLSTIDIWRKLDNHEIDVAIEAKSYHDYIRWYDLFSLDMAFAVSGDHELAIKKSISPEDLEECKLLSLDVHQYPDYWGLVASHYRKNGVTPNLFGEFDGMASLLTGVSSGLGVCFVSENTVVPEGVKIIPYKKDPPQIEVAIGVLRDRPIETYIQDFIENVITESRRRV